jgi:hypothetical protein
MKIFEKFKQMPLKVKVASIFLSALAIFMLYLVPALVLALTICAGTFFALIEVIEYINKVNKGK